MTTLVIVEHDNASLRPATLNAVAAAARVGGEIHLLVAGHACAGVAQAAAAVAGASVVHLADAPHYADQLPENLAALVAAQAVGYTHIFAAATSFGKSLLPRVAALLDVAPLSDIVDILAPDTFVRPIYAGNVMATVQSPDPIKIATVRAVAFDAVAASGGAARIDVLAAGPDLGLSRRISRELSVSARPELGAARVVVSGGRGLGSQASYHALLEPLADKLGAALGASRAAVDAGYVSNDYQVGQTGKVVAPQLYIAVGISGAIQHLAGMTGSHIIVAINKDTDAPIFQVADYGLVGDLFELVPQLTAAL